MIVIVVIYADASCDEDCAYVPKYNVTSLSWFSVLSENTISI